MRIINVIESNTDNAVSSIESFGIEEEQLSQDVVEQAEKCFVDKAVINGASPDDIDFHIENGYYANQSGYTISIVWSSI